VAVAGEAKVLRNQRIAATGQDSPKPAAECRCWDLRQSGLHTLMHQHCCFVCQHLSTMLRTVTLALSFAAALAVRNEASRLSAALDEVESDSSHSTDDPVCSITEKEDKVQYGIAVQYEMKGRCNAIKCSAYKFMTESLPHFIISEQQGGECECYKPDFMEAREDTDTRKELFSFLLNSIDSQCSPEACWNKYSSALFLAKAAEIPRLSPSKALNKPDHWNVGCKLATGPKRTFARLPSISGVVDDLENRGFGDAAQDMKKLVKVKAKTTTTTTTTEESEHPYDEAREDEEDEVVGKPHVDPGWGSLNDTNKDHEFDDWNSDESDWSDGDSEFSSDEEEEDLMDVRMENLPSKDEMAGISKPHSSPPVNDSEFADAEA